MGSLGTPDDIFAATWLISAEVFAFSERGSDWPQPLNEPTTAAANDTVAKKRIANAPSVREGAVARRDGHLWGGSVAKGEIVVKARCLNPVTLKSAEGSGRKQTNRIPRRSSE